MVPDTVDIWHRQGGTSRKKLLDIASSFFLSRCRRQSPQLARRRHLVDWTCEVIQLYQLQYSLDLGSCMFLLYQLQYYLELASCMFLLYQLQYYLDLGSCM